MTKTILPTLLTLVILFFNCSNDNIKRDISANFKSSEHTKPTKQLKSLAASSITKNNHENIPADNRYAGIPNWYLRNRVQIHTLIGIRDINDSSFFGFPKLLAQYGVTVFSRQIKASDEEPWWPSKVGTQNPASIKFNQNGKDLAKDIIDQMHSLNMKAIIYYRHSEDAEMFNKHPEWVCTDANGQAIKGERGMMLSFNSPYRNVVITRLKELAEDGADGFLFDYSHVPDIGDFSKYSQQLYKKQYGTDMITDYKNNQLIKIGDFESNTVLNFFTDLRDSLASIGKHPVLLVSGNRWPTLTGVLYNSSLFSQVILKSEVEVPTRVSLKNKKLWPFTMPESFKQQIPNFYLNAFGFSFMRDNSYGPPVIWSPGIQSSADAESISAGLISLGCIPLLHITPKTSPVNNFKNVLQWNKKYGDYFEGLVPYAATGILVSENQRNEFINNPAQAWKQVLIPTYETFEKLYKAGIPVQLVSDAALLKKADLPANIYANKAASLPNNVRVNTMQDLNEINKLDGFALAIKTGSPIFCEKDNEYTHLNYFTDNKGYLYIITAPDFKSSKEKAPNRKASTTSFAYTNDRQYANTRAFHLHIKNGFTADNSLQDIVNNTTISSSKNEKGYAVYNIDASKNALGIYRIKLK